MPKNSIMNVMQVAVRAVLGKPMTWSETLEEPCELDAKYNLPGWRKDLTESLPRLRSMCHAVEHPDGEVRILCKHTNAAAFLAFHKYGEYLLPTWLSNSHAAVVAPLRSMLLARVFELTREVSKLPDIVYVHDILKRGLRTCGCAWACRGRASSVHACPRNLHMPYSCAAVKLFTQKLQRKESYEEFRARMWAAMA